MTMEDEKEFQVAGLPGAGPIRLAVGIGNPEGEYGRTRHNAGYWFADALAERTGWSFAALKDLPVVVAGTARDLRVAKTRTYMNESGQAVGALLRYLQIEPRSLLVAHDEVDLLPGKARFKFGGGLAGHNGLRDIKRHLGTQDFWRLRIGVGRPEKVVVEERRPTILSMRTNAPSPVFDSRDRFVKHVLDRPAADDQQVISAALDKVLKNWPLVEQGQMDEAVKAVHGS